MANELKMLSQIPNLAGLAAALGQPVENVQQAWEATFGQKYNQLGSMYKRHGEELASTYEAAQTPYKPSGMDKLAKYGGLGALLLGLATKGGGQFAPLLGGLAGLGMSHARRAPEEYRARQREQLQNRLAVLQSKQAGELGMAQMDLDRAKMGWDVGQQQRKDLQGLGERQLGAMQWGAGMEFKGSEAEKERALQWQIEQLRARTRLQEAKSKSTAKPPWLAEVNLATEAGKEVDLDTQQLRDRLVARLLELDKDRYLKIADEYGGKPVPTARLAEEMKKVGDKKGWFSGDYNWNTPEVQSLVDSLQQQEAGRGKLVRDKFSDPGWLSEWGWDLLPDSTKTPSMTNTPVPPQYSGLVKPSLADIQPPPNDGSMSDEQYQRWIQKVWLPRVSGGR